jgi:hypothetical protein
MAIKSATGRNIESLTPAWIKKGIGIHPMILNYTDIDREYAKMHLIFVLITMALFWFTFMEFSAYLMLNIPNNK